MGLGTGKNPPYKRFRALNVVLHRVITDFKHYIRVITDFTPRITDFSRYIRLILQWLNRDHPKTQPLTDFAPYPIEY